jgi:TPR repeat protein
MVRLLIRAARKKPIVMLISEYHSYSSKCLAALSLAVFVCAAPLAGANSAMAFDPQKVFKEEKPSTKKLFRFYLTQKKQGKDDEALDVLEYAADQGNQTARWKLGKMYESGDSVDRDTAKAFQFYKEIADNYGDARPNTPEWAITGKAMVALGHYYSIGLPEAGINPDRNEARVMYTTAAMYFRDPDGQFELGKMILEGGSTLEEGTQAIRMLQLANKNGHPGALALLGHSLVEGQYVLQDVVRGLAMLTRAASIAPSEMQPWINELQQEAFALASVEQRQQAIVAASTVQ